MCKKSDLFDKGPQGCGAKKLSGVGFFFKDRLMGDAKRGEIKNKREAHLMVQGKKEQEQTLFNDLPQVIAILNPTGWLKYKMVHVTL